MKRVCTKTEQELLYQNRKLLLKGLWITAAVTKLSDVFLSLLLSFVVMFAGIFWISDTFDGSAIVFILWLLFSLNVPRAIVMLMINMVRLQKKAGLFLKQEGLIPACSEHYPLEGGLDAYTCVPNPNVLKIDRQGHVLSAAERESFAALYTGNDRQECIRLVKTLVPLVASCLMLICFILDSSGEFPFYKTAPVLFGGLSSGTGA